MSILRPAGTGIADGFNQLTTADVDWIQIPVWAQGLRILLATGSAAKEDENQRALAWYGLPVYITSETLGGEDSDEDHRTYEDIVIDKAMVSAIDEFRSKRPDEQAAVLSFMNTEDARKVAVLAEDRGLDWDVAIRAHQIWDPYRNHPDRLVREAFDTGHPFPGKRFNELRNAVGGTVKLLEMHERAVRDLRAAGLDVSDTHTSHITYHLRPLVPGLIPVPEEGITVHLTDFKRRFRPITAADRELERKRRSPFDPDDFDYPADSAKTVRQLWEDPGSDYYDARSLSARAVRALMERLEMPRLSAPVENRKAEVENARLLSSRQLSDPGVFILRNVAGHPAAPCDGKIQNLADFEHAFHTSEGAVFEALPQINTGLGSERRRQTLRKLITITGASYFAAMGNLGAPFAAGQPNAVHESLMEEGGILSFVRDLYARGTVSKDPSRMFSFFSGEEDLHEALRHGWDLRKFRPDHIPRDGAVKDRGWLQERTMTGNFGYTLSHLGSSVSRSREGNQDAFDVVYMASAAGFSSFHGGGTRKVMRQKFEGAIAAYERGYKDFHNVGIRCPVASKKEGNIGPYAQELSQRTGRPVLGDVNGDFFRIGENFCVLTEAELSERQHLILAPAHGSVYYTPGLGTMYEWGSDALHNFMVEECGTGIFPGFANNRKKLITLMNTGDMYNFMLGLFDSEEWGWLGMESYNDPYALMARHAQEAAILGYAVPDEFMDSAQTRRHLQLPQVTIK